MEVQDPKRALRLKLICIAILTISGIVAGILDALLTLALHPGFSVCFRWPDHPCSYALWNQKYLMVICGSLGGAIGLSVSWSLACAHRLWTRSLSSLFLAALTIAFLLHGLWALRTHRTPELSTSIHITLATCFLGMPPALVLTLAHSLLAEGSTLKRLWTVSLPMFGILGGLSSWSFWYFYSDPRSHYVIGWMDGALYGLLHCLGLIAIKLLHLEVALDGPTLNPAPPMDGGSGSVSDSSPAGTTTRKHPVLQSGIILAVFLSLLMFGTGLSRFIAAQSKGLLFQASDRQALLTGDDVTAVMKNWAPERGAEKASKVLHANGTYELKYEYKDPGAKVAILSISKIEPSTDDAQTTFWVLRDVLGLAQSKFHPFQLKSANLFKWGDDCTSHLLVDGPAIHGGAFAGYKGQRAILLIVGTEEPFENAEAVTSLILSVLRRLETYVP